MSTQPSLFEIYTSDFKSRQEVELSLSDYLELCRDDPMAYASLAERMVAAIGEPTHAVACARPPFVMSRCGLAWRQEPCPTC